MNKFKNYLLIAFFTFFMSIQLVNATTFTIEDGRDSADLSSYSSCSKQTLDSDNGTDYLKLDTDANGNPIVFVIKTPSSGSPSLNLYCVNKSTNKDESVTVKVKSTATIYSEYSDNEDDTTIELIVRKKLTQYSSCEINTNSDNGSQENVKVENTDDGPIITVAKVPTSKKEQTFLTCVTKDGRKKIVTIVTNSKTSHLPSPNYGLTNEEYDSEDVSNDCTSILGDIKDDGKTYDPDNNKLPSVAYVLQKIFNFMQFLGPILVIVMTIFDLVKTVTSGDKDALSKFVKTTSKRLIYAVLLFVFPSILNLILSWITANPGTCGIK